MSVGKHAPRNRVEFNKETRKKFLAIIAEGFSESHACKQVRLSWTRYKYYKRDTPTWQAKLDEAFELGIKCLEDEVNRRGTKGVLEPVVSAGKIVTFKRNYSDTLLKLAVSARSSTYAIAKPTGEDFEATLSGAAEKLLDKLIAVIEYVNTAEKSAYEAS